MGHLFPRVDALSCISCEKCKRVCPMMHPLHHPEGQSAYAAYAKDSRIRFLGSSGGMFGVLAEHLLEQGYIVYGAAFDSNHHCKCTMARTKEDLVPLMKSKYLQSDATEQYETIKRQLQQGEKVLFVSTPCQVAALKCYIGKNYDNLITIDFVCHGVPSQRLFDDGLKFEEKKYGISIKKFIFRSKEGKPRTLQHYSMEYVKNGNYKKKQSTYYTNSFYALFQQYITLRESCYDCRYAQNCHEADLTISDFHEAEDYISGLNRLDGISLIVVNTKQGMNLWTQCSSKMITWSMDLNNLIQHGICFGTGTKRPDNRDKFVQCYIKYGYDEVANRYVPLKRYWKWMIYYRMPRSVQRIMKAAIRGKKQEGN